MQVRAYNHWASLLGDRLFPHIEDLDPANLPDFGPHSVLLDFSFGLENPAVRFLGEKLARECSSNGVITRLSDVPPRSLLSRITDHYMQILANQAPIGFEAEFVNQRGVTVLYRGILLPYSSDDETIDFIFGVINWKEMADQLTADELLLEIDQALDLNVDDMVEEPVSLRSADPVTDWADSPASEVADSTIPSQDAPDAPTFGSALDDDFGNVTPLDGAQAGATASYDLPMPDFGRFSLDDDDEEYDEDEGEGESESAGYNFASLADYIEAPAKKAIDPAEFALEPYADDDDPQEFAPYADEDAEAFVDELPDDAGLYDYLASARELARAADSTEDRSRSALYAAVSRAYDFWLCCKHW